MKYKYKGRKKMWVGESQRQPGTTVELNGDEDLPWELFELIKTAEVTKPKLIEEKEEPDKIKKR